MAEEYEILNQGATQEGGGEIPPDTIEAIKVVAENIDTIKYLASNISTDGSIVLVSVDGTVTTIRLNRGTAVDLATNDFVPDEGEPVWYTDADPPVLKIGDGVTALSSLLNVLTASTLSADDLAAAVAAAQASATASASSASASADSSAAAALSATGAAESAQDSQDWAVSPTPIGGQNSAAISAGIAANIASISRNIEVVSPAIAADEIIASGHLFKKRLYNGSTLVNITVPSGLYTNPDGKEGWVIYRKQGTGNIKFIPQAGVVDKVTPQIIASETLLFRCIDGAAATAKTKSWLINKPAITAGRVVAIAAMGGNDNLAKTISLTIPGVTLTQKTTPLTFLYDPCVSIFEGILSSHAAATGVNLTMVANPFVNYMKVTLFWIEGVDPAHDMIIFPAATNNSLTTVSVTQPALPAKALVVGATLQRGAAATTLFVSASANLTVAQSGVTTDVPDAASNTNNLRNFSWARLHGVHTAPAAADFTASSTYNSAFSRNNLHLVGYPPKDVTGAAAMTLRLINGDTLSKQWDEAEILLLPNGIEAIVKLGPQT